MRPKTLLRWWLSALAVFALAALIGGPWLARRPDLLEPVLEDVAGLVRPLEGRDFLLAAFFLAKNSSVAAMALFAEQIVDFPCRFVRRVLERLRLPGRLLRLLTWRPPWAGRLLPLAVLALNGAVLAGVCAHLHASGISTRLLLAGLIPHGVPELSALFIACGAGVAGAAAGEKKDLFLRVVLPLLAAAAVLEAWVTPAVMNLAG
ncbi:stage II sporulation protein M [Desulfovirgula thermocuniculi]|uniref:stage II sporulation protein M n=1 Tax=Desulfovirgula thermocuniculi TaxID=348842 RepID=UPI00041CF309|nr:stage II sporulation protein M [Desulfovirgula thermocuniculi]